MTEWLAWLERTPLGGAPLWAYLAACLGAPTVIALALTVHDARAARRRHRQQYEQQLERWRA